MKKIDRLIKSAHESIKFRQHLKGNFTRHSETTWAEYTCDFCGMSCRVDVELGIVYGEAVAVFCIRKRKHSGGLE